jgi:dihydrodipicolinate synthase/N-acetylneuraminate lyase
MSDVGGWNGCTDVTPVPALGLARALLDDDAEAEQAVQDAFVELWQALQRGERRGPQCGAAYSCSRTAVPSTPCVPTCGARGGRSLTRPSSGQPRRPSPLRNAT